MKYSKSTGAFERLPAQHPLDILSLYPLLGSFERLPAHRLPELNILLTNTRSPTLILT